MLSLLEKMAVQLQTLYKRPHNDLDATDLFYTQRETGPNFLPPATIGNIAHCPGTVTDIPGESAVDVYTLAVNKMRKEE